MVKLPAYRLANKILENFKPQNETRMLRINHERISELTQELQQLTKLFTRAISKQWLASAVELKKRISYVTDSIEGRAKDIGPDTKEIIAGLRNYPTQLNLIEDLKAVKEEFGNLLYDQEESCMVVFSKDITFDDVNLGSFELRIPINLIGSSTTVVARTPNYPVVDEETTHPHIQNNEMCLGNGRNQFYDAIQQGRVLDAFTTLNSILITYNLNSAYVEIENWNINSEDYTECNDCGDSTHVEETNTCEDCESCYCNHCIHGCDVCDGMKCEYCMNNKCSICKDKRLCKDCTHECQICDAIFCEECMSNSTEEQTCANCQKDLDEGLETEVRPECVGQIMLPTG